MSSTNLTPPNNTTINEANVAEFLKAHPDFFTRHEGLLAEMELPHRSGQAVSLVERQVSILRERNIDMRNRLSDLLDNAKENDVLFEKTKRLVLSLIEAKNLDELIKALYRSFADDFNIHYTRLILFSAQELPSSTARVVTAHHAKDYIGKRLNANNAVSGGIDIKEAEFLFDSDASNIGSAAVAVLSDGDLLGVLAIGNQDPNYYRSSMGTLFLSYLAEILNRLIPQHLNNPS